MRVGLTGSSGFLGTTLAADLGRRGHDVVRFVRRPAGGPGERTWDGAQLAPDLLTGLDAVVHLSGAGVGDRRWTPAYRETIRSSRVQTTDAVARAVAAAGTPVLLCGSAIGIYGDTDDRVVDESSPVGAGFLAEVCQAWEAATAPATAHARVVQLRTGVVLGPGAGALKRLVPLFKAMLGAPLGSGRQWFSWIELSDWTGAVHHLLGASVAGPVNLVAPQPVTNRELTKELGRALHRPTLPVPVPAAVLRAVLGGMSSELLGSVRVAPAALLADGFVFQHPDLPSALHAVLG